MIRAPSDARISGTRKNLAEIPIAPALLDCESRTSHLLAPKLRKRHIGDAVIPDARFALGLAVANQEDFAA